MMKILLTRSMLPGDIRYIQEGLDGAVKGQYSIVIPASFDEAGILAEAADADVLLGPYVTPGILAAARQLKLIQVPWTGMDTFDFSAVQGCAVPICNTHSNADAVAELGLALVLDLLKKLSYHDRKMRRGNWNRDQQPLNLKSGLLSRQKVCVLGYGNIGRRVCRLLAAFGAEVSTVNDHAEAGEILSRVYRRGQMADAFAEADVVVCTLPLTDKTRSLISRELLAAAKPGQLLINLSRAAVIDEDALWDALERGQLGGFASDVWWNAPKRGESASYPSARHPFWELDNVVLSPHRAGFVEGSLPHLDGAIENFTNLIEGRELTGMVNTVKGY